MDALALLQKVNPSFLPGFDWIVPDHATAKALSPGTRHDGMIILTRNDNFAWQFVESGTAVDATENMAMTPTTGTGAWTRLDLALELKLAVGFGTADAAVLFTVPTGMKLWVQSTMWEVSTPFTGGSSSTIGASSSNAAYATKGDLQGGAAGDAAAALTAGYKGGTIGAKFGSNGRVVLVGGDTIRNDRITSAFTAGAGFLHVFGQQIL